MELSQLISPYTVEVFHNDYLDKAVCFASRKNPAYYNSLIDSEYLRAFLFNGGFRASECRLVKEGKDLSPYAYTGGHKKKSGFATADIDRFVDGPKVMSLYAEGYSISLMGLDRYHPSLAMLKNRLMAKLGAHVSVNLYASPDSATGLPVHEDPHDVLVLQVFGKKRWQIFDKDTALPLPGQIHEDLGAKAEVKSFVLEQGDFAYIPRGFSHRATTFDGPSMHLTIGMSSVTYFDIFQQLMIQLSAVDREMRSSFRLFRDHGHDVELLHKLIEMLSTPEAKELVGLSRASIEKQWMDGISPVRQLGITGMDLLNKDIGAKSLIQVIYPEFAKVLNRNGIFTLFYPGQSLDIHPLLEPLVVSILEKKDEVFAVEAVIDPSQQEAQIQFLKFLVKDGFLELLWGNDE